MDNIDIDGAQVIESLEDFVLGFSQTQHQAGLGQHFRAVTLGMLQYLEGLLVTGPRIAHRMGQAAYCFDVLGENTDPAVDHSLYSGGIATKIRCQCFYRGVRILSEHLFDNSRIVTGRRRLADRHG